MGRRAPAEFHLLESLSHASSDQEDVPAHFDVNLSDMSVSLGTSP